MISNPKKDPRQNKKLIYSFKEKSFNELKNFDKLLKVLKDIFKHPSLSFSLGKDFPYYVNYILNKKDLSEFSHPPCNITNIGKITI